MTTVKDTRAGLRRYKATDEIIVAWWDKEWFETALDRKLTDDEWKNIVRRCEKTITIDLTSAAVHTLEA